MHMLNISFNHINKNKHYFKIKQTNKIFQDKTRQKSKNRKTFHYLS